VAAIGEEGSAIEWQRGCRCDPISVLDA
jgi:hypothetical protein